MSTWLYGEASWHQGKRTLFLDQAGFELEVSASEKEGLEPTAWVHYSIQFYALLICLSFHSYQWYMTIEINGKDSILMLDGRR